MDWHLKAIRRGCDIRIIYMYILCIYFAAVGEEDSNFSLLSDDGDDSYSDDFEGMVPT